jgi:multiple antibiotic resistance protein
MLLGKSAKSTFMYEVLFASFFVPLSTLLAIVDPFASIGPFLAMTQNTPQQRRKVALRAVLIATLILFVVGLVGDSIFTFFGISLPALKISGGILLFVIAFEMLYAKPTRSKSTAEEKEEGIQKDDIAVFPLAVPLLAGPGAILSVFIFMERAGEGFHKLWVFAAIIATMFVSLITFWFAGHLTRLLGEIGTNLFSRLMGLVLSAISAQFIIDGLREAFPMAMKAL